MTHRDVRTFILFLQNNMKFIALSSAAYATVAEYKEGLEKVREISYTLIYMCITKFLSGVSLVT